MNNKIRHAIIAAVMLAIAGCWIYCIKNAKVESKINLEWAENIDLIEETIVKNCPKAFEKESMKSFHEKMNKIKRESGNLSNEEIEFKLLEAVWGLGDKSVQLVVQRDIFPEKDGFYPVMCCNVCDKYYAYSIDKDFKEALGCRLIKINDSSIDEVVEKSSSIGMENLPNPISYTYLKILEIISDKDREEVKFTFERDNEEEFFIKMKPGQALRDGWEEIFPHRDENTAKVLSKSNIENGIAYFKCEYSSSIAAPRDSKEFMEQHKFYQNKMNTFFSEIESKELHKLIIDMRTSFDYDPSLLKDFVERVKSIEKKNKNSKIYVITPSQKENTLEPIYQELRKSTKAIFYGESEVRYKEFKKANIVNIPRTAFVLSYVKDGDLSRFNETFKPDYIIKRSFDDFWIKGIDNIYEKIKQDK